ncbi:MAG: C40 family peptidase [Candidatus Marinimicrobia bacterium]|nr:C40 family peptidase [Candidatus Neomarinimicrobiota bacterium]
MGITQFYMRPSLQLILLLILLSGCAHISANPEQESIQAIIERANSDFYLDQRIWYQDIHAEVLDQTVVLRGEAFFKMPVAGIGRKLKRAGYTHTVIDSVHYLPEIFENDLAYGIILEPYVMGRYKPVTTKQEGTEMLYGEPVRLIREHGTFFQVQSNIGYLGFIPKTALRQVNLEEWGRYHLGKQAIFYKDITLETGQEIIMGTRLPYLGDDHILLADGSEISLPKENYKISDPANNPLRKDIISSAEQYLGLPYVWGGRSSEGLDCSGFVMQSYGMNNIFLPRDSDEIANVGRIIGYPGWMDAMLPGDLLFFSGSRRMVTHTAIYLGAGKVIHSLGSGVQIQSLNPDDPDYSENLALRFIFAKRIFE